MRSENGNFQAVRWYRGRSTILPVQGEHVMAYDINNRGEIVAMSMIDSGAYPPVTRGYLIDARGRVTDLGVGPTPFVNVPIMLNDAGQVAGTNSLGIGFRWDRGRLLEIAPSGSFSVVTDMNERGQVVGYLNRDGHTRAFIWSNGTTTELGTLGGSSSEATAINDLGQVVGTSSTANPSDRDAFIWSAGRMTALGLPGESGRASRINNLGQVIATDRDPSAASLELAYRSYLWQHGRLVPLAGLDGGEAQAYDLNEFGVVVGASLTADPAHPGRPPASRPARWRTLGRS